MSINLTPYPEYQQTGQEWLGSVPAHWIMAPHRAVFREIIDKGHPEEDMLSVTMQRGVIRQADLLRNSSKKDSSNADKSNYKLVHDGDLAYNKMRAWQGALGVSRFRGIISPAYVVVRPRAAQNPEFYHYLMRTPAFMTEAERWSYGITSDQWSLRADDFKCIQTVIPPPDEQDAIVRFIRYIDQRVNRLLKTKRRLIELLNEQKQAIIHRAVTRGLDPDVPLKPSGVEWLGDVPEHWEVTKLGRLVDLQTGYPFNSEGFTNVEDDIKLLRGINVAPGEIRWESVVRWPKSQSTFFSDFALRAGDIVLGMDRPIVGAGTRLAVVAEQDLPCFLLQRVARIRPSVRLNQNYLTLLLSGRGFASYLKPIFTGISVPHVSPEQIQDFNVPVPPLSEQVALVKKSQWDVQKTNNAIAQAQREIELIREYRTRLVSDVVTGQLDVRGLALPKVDAEVVILGDEVEGLDELADEEAEGAEE